MLVITSLIIIVITLATCVDITPNDEPPPDTHSCTVDTVGKIITASGTGCLGCPCYITIPNTSIVTEVYCRSGYWGFNKTNGMINMYATCNNCGYTCTLYWK